MILLIASDKDIASLNIKEQILNKYPFSKTEKTFEQNPTYTADINDKEVTLVTLKEESVKAQNLPDNFPNAKLSFCLATQQSKWQTYTVCSCTWELWRS